MGLSASQARLLNLTNRMHQIEYNASRIEAMKLQMANESRRVYEDYLEALDEKKIQHKTLTANGGVTFVDFTSYEGFLEAGFAMVVHGLPEGRGDDKPQIPNPALDTWDAGLQRAIESKVAALGDSPTPEQVEEATTQATNEYIAANGTRESIPETIDDPNWGSDNVQVCTTKDQLIEAIKLVCKDEKGQPLDITNGLDTDPQTTITNLINSGFITIIEKPSADKMSKYNEEDFVDGFPKYGSKAYEDYETSVAINTSLQEVQDEVELRKAEAKYEADMKRIDMKDRRYDADLAALDNERNAIKQEMETLKTVARDNVDRTFKIFS